MKNGHRRVARMLTLTVVFASALGLLLTRPPRRVQPARRLRQMLVLLLSVALVLTSLPVIERLTPPAQAQISVRICDPNSPAAADQIIQQCALGGGGEGALESTVINEL